MASLQSPTDGPVLMASSLPWPPLCLNLYPASWSSGILFSLTLSINTLTAPSLRWENRGLRAVLKELQARGSHNQVFQVVCVHSGSKPHDDWSSHSQAECWGGLAPPNVVALQNSLVLSLLPYFFSESSMGSNIFWVLSITEMT